MKRPALLLLLSLATPFSALAADTVLPAGSIIQCTVSEPKLSSRMDKIGDPVLCTLSRSELYGRAAMPYGSYMVGHFEDYKDPGHFVGKGWIELRFDRLIVAPDTIIPIDARVVEVPNYPVDADGKIHGRGHAVRDTIEWFIPVLWPIDLINLPRRGPYVVIKPETRITLKVMDDVGIPFSEVPFTDHTHQPALIERNQPQPPVNQAQSYPQQQNPPQNYAPQTYQPQPAYQNYGPNYAPNYAPNYSYAPPQQAPQTIIYNNYPPSQQQQQVVIVQQPAPRQRVVYSYPPPPAYPYGFYRGYPY